LTSQFGVPNIDAMPEAADLIQILGGTSATARKTRVKPPSVHEWRGKRFPPDKLVLVACEIEKKSIWRRWDLFPDDWHRIWPELVGQEGAPSVPGDSAGP